jgi:hypothetical protein
VLTQLLQHPVVLLPVLLLHNRLVVLLLLSQPAQVQLML